MKKVQTKTTTLMKLNYKHKSHFKKQNQQTKRKQLLLEMTNLQNIKYITHDSRKVQNNQMAY